MMQVPGVCEALTNADALIPIPLTRQALLARGYNQADLLARRLAPRNTLAALRRVKAQAPQHRLTRGERLRSMRGAFAVAPGAPIAGRHLLIVDDVMTTGATATAASQCLLAAGAASVSVLVLARTGRPGAHSDDNRAAPATP
jgi:ComF family protein